MSSAVLRIDRLRPTWKLRSGVIDNTYLVVIAKNDLLGSIPVDVDSIDMICECITHNAVPEQADVYGPTGMQGRVNGDLGALENRRIVREYFCYVDLISIRRRARRVP